MLVSVVSPHCSGNGNTLTSMLLALGLGEMKKKVLLTHTNPSSEAFFTYLNLQQYEDKTSTPTQLVKLLREEAIKPEELSDFCKMVNESVYVFTNNKTNFTEDDMYSFTKYLLQMSEYDYIVYDVNDLQSDTANLVIRESEVIIFNLTQSITELNEFNRQKEKLMKLCQGKKVILVCNKFSATVGTNKDIAKILGVKLSVPSQMKKEGALEGKYKDAKTPTLDVGCNVIHYNPWLAWACNNGQLLKLFKTIRAKGHKVVELDKDIASLASIVAKAKLAVLKQRQKENKTGGARA